eukprot:GEZU01022594.1.p2 GENE.GEZU01022594.1~~GEZU01022594.1.p2  ORF type:complete len:140 (-),score=22.84 GEZU01022594.1:640-1059(-)
MIMNNLFLINGLIEFVGAVLVLRDPQIALPGVTFSGLSKEFRNWWATLAIAFGLASIGFRKVSDLSDAKHLFALAWFIYHATLAVRAFPWALVGVRRRQLHNRMPELMAMFLVHAGLCFCFFTYLNSHNVWFSLPYLIL